MAKMVGLSRKIKLQWLDKTVELALQDISEQDIHDKLNEYLSFEISSPTVLRKTREILMNVWVRDDTDYSGLRGEALKTINASPTDSLPVHWCMLLATYPVFADVCRLIGKLSEFQNEFTLAQIRQKLYDTWGESTTLFHSLNKILETMRELGAMQCVRPGRYRIVTHPVHNKQVVAFMVYTMMLVNDESYYRLSDIDNSSLFFPFDYHIDKQMLFADAKFAMNNFGGDLTVSLGCSEPRL